jgi:hypothetical protein
VDIMMPSTSFLRSMTGGSTNLIEVPDLTHGKT